MQWEYLPIEIKFIILSLLKEWERFPLLFVSKEFLNITQAIGYEKSLVRIWRDLSKKERDKYFTLTRACGIKERFTRAHIRGYSKMVLFDPAHGDFVNKKDTWKVNYQKASSLGFNIIECCDRCRCKFPGKKTHDCVCECPEIDPEMPLLINISAQDEFIKSTSLPFDERLNIQ